MIVRGYRALVARVTEYGNGVYCIEDVRLTVEPRQDARLSGALDAMALDVLACAVDADIIRQCTHKGAIARCVPAGVEIVIFL